MTDLQKWLEENVGHEAFTPGLQRIKLAISLFGLDFSGKTVVAVAGTNGKGQCARQLYRNALQKRETALWTSPHLTDVRERFSKGANLAGHAELAEIFGEIQAVLEHKRLRLSYYEFLFLAFLLFAKDCSVLILEAGLGGRLDAINALSADLVLLASVSRDHQEYLGPRLDGILGEKIALTRPGKKVITNFESAYLRRLAKSYCARHGVGWTDLFERNVCVAQDSFHQRNKKLAAAAAVSLFGKADAPEQDQGEASPLIRFKVKLGEVEAVCHGLPSHNPDGVRKGVQFLNDAKYTKMYRFVLLSFSERRFEDALAMLKTLKFWQASRGAESEIVLTSFIGPKAMQESNLKRLARQAQVKFINDANTFFQQYRPGDHETLVMGSNYFIGGLCENGRFARG